MDLRDPERPLHGRLGDGADRPDLAASCLSAHLFQLPGCSRLEAAPRALATVTQWSSAFRTSTLVLPTNFFLSKAVRFLIAASSLPATD